MSYNSEIQGLMDQMKSLNNKVEALIAVAIEDKEPEIRTGRGGRPIRGNSLAASVSDEERKAVDSLCEELMERHGWRLTRSALLRIAWLHFLDHHEEYDLSPYMD